MSVKPFSPEEALAAKPSAIPSEIIEAANQLLAERYNTGTIKIKLVELRARAIELMEKNNNFSDATANFSANGWLDIEPIYIAQGWKVMFDKPGYDENYDAFFEFSPFRGMARA